MATIDDVARLAGVAPTTVSNALSGKAHVAPGTRKRILAVADELRYQPNTAARNLASRHAMAVGVIVPVDPDVLSDGGLTEFLVAAADRLATHGYQALCLVERNPDASDVRKLVRSGQVDGTLLLQVRTADARVEALKAEGKPFVTIGRTRHGSGVVRADVDFARAADIAVDHLLGLGHQRIGFLCTGQDPSPIFGFQWYALCGFRKAHRDRSLHLPNDQIFWHARESEDGMLPALQPLLDGSLQVTALVATTFSGAVLASEILSARGRRIPEDISIVALADPRPSALHTPPMTVVRFSAVSLTETAVDLLIGMLAGRPPRRLEHLVPVELAASGSTGPPAVTLRTGTSIGRQRSLPRPRQQDGAGSAQARP